MLYHHSRMLTKKRNIIGLILTVLFFLISPKIIYAEEQIIFTATGDYGNSANTDKVLDGIKASGANFHIATGDLSYGYISESNWCAYVKSHVGVDFPFQLVTGNHEMDEDAAISDITKFVACLPNRMDNISGLYPKEYYFDFNNLARFIQISPNITTGGETISYVSGNSHYNWLSNAIDNAKSSNIPWVIVSMHELCLSAATKSCEIGTDLLNLLVSKKVDLIVQAHDHTYQRSKQLSLGPNCLSIPTNTFNSYCVVNETSPDTYQKNGGSIIVISGAGGDSIYSINSTDPEVPYFAKLMGQNMSPRYGFFKGVINENKLIGSFEGISGMSNFSDSFTIVSNQNTPTPTPTASPSPTPTVSTVPTLTPNPDTFIGSYFNNVALSGTPAFTRNDSTIDFDWSNGSPSSSISADHFSARWTKTQNFSAGNYRFSVTGDDGIRLKIDGVTVIDKWKDQGPTTYTYDVVLNSGNHNIVYEYYENTEGAVAKMSWAQISTPSPSPTPITTTTPTQTASPTISPTPTPTPILTPSPNPTTSSQPSQTFNGEYFTNKTFSGSPTLTRTDQTVNFDWGIGTPASGISEDGFSVRWTTNQFFSSGTYRFSVTADDGIRLKIDGVTVIDKWKDQGPTTYTYDTTLITGQHNIITEYYENTEGAVAKLSWTLLNQVSPTPTSTPLPQPNPTISPTPTPSPVTTNTPSPTNTNTPSPAPSPTTTPPVVFVGQYYSNTTLTGSPKLTRNDSAINFDWGAGRPTSKVSTDNFSVRWTSNFISTGGPYRFTTTTDDGVRLKIDGVTVIDKWKDQGSTQYTYETSLTPGTHTIIMEYYEKNGGAVAKLFISKV